MSDLRVLLLACFRLQRRMTARDEPRAGLKRGYYLLNTDGGTASNGRRRAGDPLGRAIGALLRTTSLGTVAQISRAIGPATHNVAEYQALIED